VTAGAQPEPSHHIVEVTKVTENAPDPSTFEVEVNCDGTVHELTFDEDGGTQSVDVGTWLDGPQTCDITEPEDGGASSTEIDPGTCEFPGKESASVEGDTVYEDVVCSVTIENSFDETPTTTTPEVTIQTVPNPTVVVVPTPVVASPQFTG
jgi:hypothetical protein